MKKILSLLLLAATWVSCKDSTKDPVPLPADEPFINVDVARIDFDRIYSSKTLDVDTNIEELSCQAPADWCEIEYKDGVVTISVDTNDKMSSRSTVLTMKGKIGDKDARRSLTIMQSGKSATLDAIGSDERITVASGTASTYQGGEEIEKSFDGNFTTIYHSLWSGTVTPENPATLTYNFSNAGTMDYLVYHPRTDGTNGHFKEFDLYVATAANPTLTKYGSYDFGGSGMPAIVSFSPALQNPTQIQFVVKSGNGDISGRFYASCAEMQFFRKNTGGFDASTIFTDATCSALKPGVGKSDIANIENLFFRELALEIFEGTYEPEFRVQNYRAWEHPDVMAERNKTGTYSLRDNPTGIYVRTGEELVVIVGDLQRQNIGIFVQDPTKMISGSSFALKPGVNKFKVTHPGLIYVMYHTRNWTGNEPEVKINIVTGHVNGYFDLAKHKTKEKWTELLSKATFEHFDLVGEYAHLTFQTEAFKGYTPDGVALVKKYDDMVRLEQEFMGLFKYNRAFKNRMYFLAMSGSSYMHASAYYTGYDVGTQNDILKLTEFSTGSIWGPAHEVGHVNQTRPGFCWKGMTEVSNNVFSLYIQTEFGNRSRLLDVYSKAFTQILDAGICYNAHDDVFCKLVPFWQLKLYMHDVLDEEDFYKDLYEKIRLNPNPATNGACQMEFVKAACDVAQLDLTDFFGAWGFLLPIDIVIDDYGPGQFLVTQAMVDDTKAYIAGKNYPKPARNFERITDSNLANYR